MKKTEKITEATTEEAIMLLYVKQNILRDWHKGTKLKLNLKCLWNK